MPAGWLRGSRPGAVRLVITGIVPVSPVFVPVMRGFPRSLGPHLMFFRSLFQESHLKPLESVDASLPTLR